MLELKELKKSIQCKTFGKAMHYRIADALRADILKGFLAPGSKLPTSSEFTNALGVSPVTVQNAIRVLSAEGLVIPRRKLGTFVSQDVPVYDGKVLLLMASRPNRDDTFLWQYFHGVVRAFADHRLEASVEFDLEAWEGDMERFEQIISRRTDCRGVVVLSPGRVFLEKLERITRPPVRIVVMSAAVDSPVVSWGHSDDYGMCYNLVCKLADMGHRRITFGYRCEIWDLFPLKRRREGFLRAVDALGLRDTARCVHEDDMPSHIMGTDRPTALIMDLSLASQRKMLEMFDANNISIPHDLSVIGYDATCLKTAGGLQLAAVSQPFEQVAREIARHMSRHNDGRFEMTIAQRFLPGQTLMKLG